MAYSQSGDSACTAGDIRIFPVHCASGAGSAGLHAGASVKNDQDVFAQVPGLFFLSFAQAFARRHHQNDGDDAPGDSEHGQKRAQFVGPEGAQHIADEIAQNHCCYGRGRRPNVSRGRRTSP